MQKKSNKSNHDDFRLSRLLTHYDKTLSYKNYSIQRFDLLIVSLSGAGIYVVLEVLKFIKTNEGFKSMYVNTIMLKAAGLLFLISVMTNFLSQWSGFSANKKEAQCTNTTINQIREIKKKKKSKLQCDIERLDRSIAILNKVTGWLNILATLSVFAALILLVSFILQTF